MARLTKAAAARQLHISRTTLYKLIDQGRLSATPDGLIDSAELVRVAPAMDVQTRRPLTQVDTPSLDAIVRGSAHDERPGQTSSLNSGQVTDERQSTSIEQALDMVREQMQLMRDELQAAREERAMLLQMLQQAQSRYDRLLDVPRPVPVVPSGEIPQIRPTPAVPSLYSEQSDDRGAMRRRIVALLQAHPAGLTPAAIRSTLQVTKPLAHTCLAMARDGLLQRLGQGRYAVA